MARYLDREPMTTSNPTDANLAASDLPAGPVPPRRPMRTPQHYGKAERGVAVGREAAPA
jgi:hypothetical protein